MSLRMLHRVETCRESARQDLRRLADHLRALSPLAVLDRGYSITQTRDGSVVRSPEHVSKGDTLNTTVARGRIRSIVKETERGEHDGNEEKGI